MRDVKECYGDLPGVFICDGTAEDVAEKLKKAMAIRQPFGGCVQRLID